MIATGNHCIGEDGGLAKLIDRNRERLGLGGTFFPRVYTFCRTIDTFPRLS